MADENNTTQPPETSPPDAPGRLESNACTGQGVGAFVEFGLQSPAQQPECRDPRSLLLITLAGAHALLSCQYPEGVAMRTPVSDESFWFVPDGTPHSVHWHEPVPVLRILLPRDLVSSLMPERLLPPRVVRLVDIVRLNWAVAEIIGEIRANVKNDIFPPLSESRAQELGVHLLRALHGSTACCRLEGLPDDRFHAVTDFIEVNLTQKLSREFLAKADGQSLHHFARMFKARTGLTPRQYVDRRRCFRARELIESGRRLADAAADVGFFDQPEMCRKFNTVFGWPPSTFARKGTP